MSLRKLLTLFIVLMALGTTSSWASCTRLSSPTVMLDMVVGRVVVPPDLPVGSVILTRDWTMSALPQARSGRRQTTCCCSAWRRRGSAGAFCPARWWRSLRRRAGWWRSISPAGRGQFQSICCGIRKRRRERPAAGCVSICSGVNVNE